jgi:hypothetical protein
MAWLKWIFEPILEALTLDNVLSNAPSQEIQCGTLDSYDLEVEE